jgi:tetratricopeptide (TPR) repeat protein
MTGETRDRQLGAQSGMLSNFSRRHLSAVLVFRGCLPIRSHVFRINKNINSRLPAAAQQAYDLPEGGEMAMMPKLVTYIALIGSVVSISVAQQPPSPPILQSVPTYEEGQSPRVQSTRRPLTEGEVRDMLKQSGKDLDPVYKALDERGVDFDLDPKIAQAMREAGADDPLLQAIWKAGPTGRGTKSATLTSSSGVPLHANFEEAMGYKTIENELDPGRRLRMVAEFQRRFPSSELLSSVYAQAAKACQQQGDLSGVVEYGEKSLKLDSNNLFSLLMVAMALPQPRMLQGDAQQTAQQLATAKADADHALRLIAALPAQPNEDGDHLRKRKDALSSDAHTALATVYMERDETDKSIDQFKTAISLTPKPNPQLYFRLGEVYTRSGKKDEAIAAFTKAAELGHGTVLQQYAEERLAQLKKP